MSTRSNIAMVLKDGKSAKMVYCHSDGYPSWNGRILLENYNTDEKVQELIKGGNISSLGEVIGTKHDFDNRPEGVTTYYKRDRGESDQESQRVRLDPNIGWESILEQEYLYLWKDGAWHMSDHGAKLVKLTPKLCKE
jgi:hypothetical protein